MKLFLLINREKQNYHPSYALFRDGFANTLVLTKAAVLVGGTNKQIIAKLQTTVQYF